MFPFSRNRTNRSRSPAPQGRSKIQQHFRQHHQQQQQQEQRQRYHQGPEAKVSYHDQPQKKQKPENFDNLISRTSIQNQFALLTNQRDNFDRETKIAEKELEEVQSKHQTIKDHHNYLFEANRQAKQELGRRMEKLALLKDEEDRLRRLVGNEFKAIRGCTNYSNILEQRNVKDTKKHTAEINYLNFESASILEHRIHKKTEKCISYRSVKKVVVPALKKALRYKNKPQLSKKKKQLSKSIKRLKKASKQHDLCIAYLTLLKAEEHRQFGANHADRAHQVQNNTRGDHVDLFYGRSDCDEQN